MEAGREALVWSRSQARAIKTISEKKSVLLHGPAGTGKSAVVHYIQKEVYKESANVAVTATTGIAATTIGGTTLHAWMGVGLAKGKPRVLVDRIMASVETRSRWQTTNVLIIDEVSMLSGRLFDKVDAVARLVRGRLDTPFGGIQIILCGDFYQLPPVNKHHEWSKGGSESDYCFQSSVWRDMVTKGDLVYVEMEENIRQRDDKSFGEMLNRLRVGRLNMADKQLLMDRVGQRPDRHVCPTQLFPLVDEARKANAVEFQKLPGTVNQYKGVFGLAPEPGSKRLQSDIHYHLHKMQLMVARNPPVEETVELKLHTQVMLRRNLDIRGGLVNGSRGVVVGFRDNWPVVKFLHGATHVIMPQTWNFPVGDFGKVTFTQLPLIQAWAMTIHKSQSLTIDCLSVSLGASMFASGQAYTALSRAQRLESVYITALDIETLDRVGASKRVKDAKFV